MKLDPHPREHASFPGLGSASTPAEVLLGRRLQPRPRSQELLSSGAAAGPAGRRRGPWEASGPSWRPPAHGCSDSLTGTAAHPAEDERARGALGVSLGTISYYLREDLLGPSSEVVRTSRNMAYYPQEYVERIG